jgi:hypothetical protein
LYHGDVSKRWKLRNTVFAEMCAGWSQWLLRQAHTCDWTLNTNFLNISLKCSVHVTNNISFPFRSLCCLAFQKAKINAASYEILGSAEMLCFGRQYHQYRLFLQINRTYFQWWSPPNADGSVVVHRDVRISCKEKCFQAKWVFLWLLNEWSVQWRTQEFCSGGVQQIHLRAEVRETGDVGAVAP